MSTIADGLKALAYDIRGIPGEFGLRPYTVAIVVGSWSGQYTGRGLTIGEMCPITEGGGQPPKLRDLTTEELALGNIGKGGVRIGPITPSFPGGGNSIETLKPALGAGQTVHVVITGPEYPNGAKFLIKDVQTDHALHYMLICEPVSEVVP